MWYCVFSWQLLLCAHWEIGGRESVTTLRCPGYETPKPDEVFLGNKHGERQTEAERERDRETEKPRNINRGEGTGTELYVPAAPVTV